MCDDTDPGDRPALKSNEIEVTPEMIEAGRNVKVEAKIIDCDKKIYDFYASLFSRQGPLGSEFEKVLYDNLWDLCAS